MKYFIDTEFTEGIQTNDSFWFRFTLGHSQPVKPTIDLISIGIVAEDGREYYAISKDFNIKEAWNRYDLTTKSYNIGFGWEKEHEVEKVYWIRENVLKPIYIELKAEEQFEKGIGMPMLTSKKNHIEFNKAFIKGNEYFTYEEFEKLVNKYGKTREELQKEIIEFVTPTSEYHFCKNEHGKWDITYQATKRGGSLPEFYGYYSDYDWVVFCWIFGKMIDLPNGFPMYCIDLKQELDRKSDSQRNTTETGICKENRLQLLKSKDNFPKSNEEHNALADARWTKKLYDFLQTL